jgi:thiamine biosynthesis lipoprotein ApbE
MSPSRNPVTIFAAVLFCLASWCRGAEGRPEHSFRHDHVLGTSLDLTVRGVAPPAAQLAEQAALAEVERLRVILSTYDPASQISRLNRVERPVACDKELIEVLTLCDDWRQRSGGAFNAQLGRLIALWKQAEKLQTLPDDTQLAQVVAQANRPAWQIYPDSGQVRRFGAEPLNVDALAKGYIVDKALAAARAACPQATGILLDIGGDLATWGRQDDAWRIGIADPHQPADNAAPLLTLRLRNHAVATSGAYERYYTIGGRRYSHIFDPRTGCPAEGVASATAIAPDCATADAMATILCVLRPEEGLRLVRSLRAEGRDVHCLLVLPDGRQARSDGMADLIEPLPVAGPATAPAAWPRGFQLTVNVTIRQQTGRKTHRPYVATWIEDAQGRPVRTLAVWGREREYLRELSKWWSFARNDSKLLTTVTRASRGPGRYTLAWDGLDDKGKPAPPGLYTVRVESAREKAPHVVVSGKIACDGKSATVRIDGNSELDPTELVYGPKPASP